MDEFFDHTLKGDFAWFCNAESTHVYSGAGQEALPRQRVGVGVRQLCITWEPPDDHVLVDPLKPVVAVDVERLTDTCGHAVFVVNSLGEIEHSRMHSEINRVH
eukprot:983753_1